MIENSLFIRILLPWLIMPEDSELTSYDSINVGDYLAHIERPNSWNNLYERPATIALLPDLKDKNVLDIGCASGYYTAYALKAGASVTSVDISQTMLDVLASSIKSPVLTICRADVSKPMPFLKSGAFDCIICSLMLHYLKDWNVALAELYRVMKKGGRLIISTHHPFDMFRYLKLKNYFDFKLVEDTWGQNGPHPIKVHYYYRPLKEVLRPIIESKFRIISIDEPLPTELCQDIDTALYGRLSEGPGFLFFVLEK